MVDFYNLLMRRKKKIGKDCIEIFYQKARLLLYVDILSIRSVLVENIFEDLEISSEVMTKERFKQSETLNVEIMKSLHAGSYAFIFWAIYEGRSVALKCYKLSKQCLQVANSMKPTQFSYELQFLHILRKKKHPNIIELIDYDYPLQCLVLEYVSYGSLQNYLSIQCRSRLNCNDLTFGELIIIAVRIAGALDVLENEGIIHLSLRAKNILISENANVKLSGFQFCRTMSQIEENGVANVVLKSDFKWMDPQALSFKSIHPRTVTWSFGVLLHELLTLGCEPYTNFTRHLDHGESERETYSSSETQIHVSQIYIYNLLVNEIPKVLDTIYCR